MAQDAEILVGVAGGGLTGLSRGRSRAEARVYKWVCREEYLRDVVVAEVELATCEGIRRLEEVSVELRGKIGPPREAFNSTAFAGDPSDNSVTDDPRCIKTWSLSILDVSSAP